MSSKQGSSIPQPEGDSCEQPTCCYCDTPCTDDDVVAGTETDDAPLFICVGCCDQFYREYLEAVEAERVARWQHSG